MIDSTEQARAVRQNGRDASFQSSDLENPEDTALKSGLPGFDAWRIALERRYTVMPLWYWNDRLCREQYATHVRRAIDWQQRERMINAANTGFQLSLSRKSQISRTK